MLASYWRFILYMEIEEEVPPEIIVDESIDEDEEELQAMAARIEVLEAANLAKDEKIASLEAEVTRAHERIRVLEEHGTGDMPPKSHIWGRRIGG